jgi:hypothetical protein
MALALGGVSGQDRAPALRERDDVLPNEHKLTLDSTGRFLAVPVRVAGSSSQAPQNASLRRHLASLERICGN